MKRCLQALDLWEPGLDAWVHREDPANLTDIRVDPEMCPLAGVPFAVKDVIDVCGQPTRYGSAAFPDAQPALSDAPVVGALRKAGAIPVGKTRSTEFAFIDPTTTCNPYDFRYSPGGSSSGSGAVVGAGIVPFALGTQTAGSLCRPAAYCGAFAYKPGLGVLPADGMSPLSPTFDAIGVIAHSAEWLGRVFDVLAAGFNITPDGKQARASTLRIALVTTPDQNPSPAMCTMMLDTIARLTDAGHTVDTMGSPVDFQEMINKHRTIMLSEMAENLGTFVSGRESALQSLFKAALADGAGITAEMRNSALAIVKQALVKFWNAYSSYDLLLAYPVPAGAPKGLSTTGDQSYLTPWTVMGGPLVSLPSGRDGKGMPLGILLAAAPGKDRFLVSSALELAGLLAPAPRPVPPQVPVANPMAAIKT